MPLRIVILSVLCSVLIGCFSLPPEERSQSKAQHEYNRISRLYELKALDAASDSEREALWREALRAYSNLLEKYPDSRPWSAKSLLAVADLHARLGDTTRALATYQEVVSRYPDDEWESLQALRSAGELLWIRGNRTEASAFYRQIIERYDRPGMPPPYQATVRLARDRLREAQQGRSQ